MNTMPSPLPEKRAFVTVAIIAVIALVAGLLYATHLGDRLRYPDEQDYVALARSLHHEGAYALGDGVPTAYRPPGYAFVLAGASRLSDSVTAYRLLNVLFLTLSILLAACLVRREHGLAAGAVAAALVLLYPVNLYTAGTLYPQTLGTVGLLLLLLGWQRIRRGATWPACGLGILSGAMVLTVPAFVFACGWIAAWSAIRRRLGVGVLVAWGLGVAVLMAPWAVRNYGALGAFVPISTNSGINLLLGNSENTTPNAGVNVDIRHYRKAAAGLDEVRRNRQFTRDAIGWVRENPGAAATLYVRKFLNYFNYRNELFVKGEASPWRDALMLTTYVPLLLLVLVRFVPRIRVRLTSFEWLLLGVYVLNGAFQAIFFTRIRHRVPFDALLVCLAAPLVWRGMVAVRERLGRNPARSGGQDG